MTSEPRFDELDARYEIIDKVAQGGMGIIYRVHDRALGRTVAMKVCSFPAAAASGVRDSSDAGTSKLALSSAARFVEEAKITARLDHPGIVPVHDLGVSSDGRAYFLMPLVKGRSLSEIFALSRKGEDGWNLNRALGALIQVSQAVAYAHSKGVVHRDLKPANVMVGRFGQVYVLDWGLAKLAGERETLAGRSDTLPAEKPADATSGVTALIASESSLQTEDGAIVGTPVYMSPEQASGRGKEVDARSDVYALGAMLYELLAGYAPYLTPGSPVSPAVILARIRSGPPRSLRKVAPLAPEELVAVSERAMAPDPLARYASAVELAEDLQAFLDHRVVSAYRTGAIAEIKAWCRRHRTLLAALSGVAAASVLLIAVIDWLVQTRQAEDIFSRAADHVGRYHEIDAEVPALQEDWVSARLSVPEWYPVWQRSDELSKYRALEAARRELDSRFNGAVLEFSSVLRIAPGSGLRREARQRLAELYLRRYRSIEAGQMIVLSEEYYRRQIEELRLETPVEELDPTGRVAIRSRPPGARVYCFRYEEAEDTRLLPRPFDPRTKSVAGEPFLRVARIVVPERHQHIFRAGDRILSVRGQPIRTRADLARAIEGLEHGESVPVSIERRGSRLDRDWIPFATGTGNLLEKLRTLRVIHEQLGLVLEGYPLDFRDECRAGEAREDQELMLELPKGSYLLVLRREGYADVRLPIVMPWRRAVETVELVEDREIPPGFAYVPEGPYSSGGDRYAFQSLERREAELPAFFIGIHEVTVAEYADFLNDLDASGRFDERDEVRPSSKEVRAALAQLHTATDPEELRLAVAPEGNRVLARAADGSWRIPDANPRRLVYPTSPISNVSQLAAREYAHWRSERDPKWNYRLPNDLEWEKAARGVDRRTHVWGEYLVWSYSWNANGLWSAHLPPGVGLFDTDESVYGIHDLAGSVDELTSSQILIRYTTRRGGNWYQSDSQNLRIATRNGRLATGRGTETGFRLVAEPKAPRAE